MDRCGGTLLTHADGTLAACSEELEGRRCAGNQLEHAGGALPCEAVLGAGGCELCSMEQWSPREWTHAVHVGRQRRARLRCTAHTAAVHFAPVGAGVHFAPVGAGVRR